MDATARRRSVPDEGVESRTLINTILKETKMTSDEQFKKDYSEKFEKAVIGVDPDIHVFVRVGQDVFAQSFLIEQPSDKTKIRCKTVTTEDVKMLFELKDALDRASKEIACHIAALSIKPGESGWVDEICDRELRKFLADVNGNVA